MAKSGAPQYVHISDGQKWCTSLDLPDGHQRDVGRCPTLTIREVHILRRPTFDHYKEVPKVPHFWPPVLATMKLGRRHALFTHPPRATHLRPFIHNTCRTYEMSDLWEDTVRLSIITSRLHYSHRLKISCRNDHSPVYSILNSKLTRSLYISQCHLGVLNLDNLSGLWLSDGLTELQWLHDLQWLVETDSLNHFSTCK